eukprot:6467387-Amphidinium_carterae.2
MLVFMAHARGKAVRSATSKPWQACNMALLALSAHIRTQGFSCKNAMIIKAFRSSCGMEP